MPRIRRREWVGVIAVAAVLIGLLPAQAIAAPPSTGTSTPVDLVAIPAEKTAPESSTGAGTATDTGQTTPTADPPSAATTTAPAASTGTVTFSGTQPASFSGAGSVRSAVYVKPATTAGPRVVTVDDTTVQAGTTPVSLGQATDVTNAPAPTGTWQVAIADPTTGPASSVDGPVVSVTPPATGATPVDVVLDYTKFQDLYPADWSDRLTWVELPACFLTTPDTDGCDDATVLDTTNDPTTHTIRASVTPDTTGASTATAQAAAQASGIHPASWVTPADTGATPSVLAAVSAVSGPGGNWAATPLAQSGRWTAGSSSGGFQWTYDLQTPAAPAGPAPKVAFSYSSQSVDGRTEVSSGQVSTIGEGWSYEPGHIERRYRTCSQDRDPVKDADGTSHDANNATHKTGDLCWASDNAVMTLNGSTVALVKDDQTGVWHVEGDDGTVITHSEPGGADTGEWVVTTRDGTKYHFGKVNVGGGHAATNSTGSVPVFGNHPGEPCYNSSFDQSSCTQNWFWGLDLVEDTHGNAMVVDYTADTNYYARNNKFSHPVTYTRDVHPTKIEYGLRTDNLGATPQFHVDFTYATRCIDAGDACNISALTSKDPSQYNNWYDTPTNLVCTGESGKQCHTTSPTFFSAWRMTGVSTWAPRADGVTREVDGWALDQAFPQEWYDGTTPALWLKSITRKGYSSDGSTSQSTNPVQFLAATGYIPSGGTTVTSGLIPTRVSNGSTDPRPTYARPRIGEIVTGTGEDIQVTYKGGCATRPDDSTASNNHGLCYPEHWSPGGDSDNPPLEWFNKYVVDHVLEIDASGSGHTSQMVTYYDYYDWNTAPNWAKDDDEFTKPSLRTYSQWRGYDEVTVRKGANGPANQTATSTRFFRGMGSDSGGTCSRQIWDRNHAVVLGCDLPEYQGLTAEVVTFNASPGPRTVQDRQLSFPQSTLTASRARQDDTALDAHRVLVTRTDDIQTVSTGTRTVRSDTTYDSDGLPSTVQSSVIQADSGGTVTSTGDYQCTVNTYTNNTGANIIGLPAEVRTTATSCAGADKATTDQVMADTRTFYDIAAGQFGKCTDTIAAPSTGLATEVCTIDGDGTSWIHSASTTYDSLGRVHTVTDAQQHTTTTDYTPATGAATSVKNTNTLNWSTTTTVDPGRGTTLSTTDPNQRVSRSSYDALGRLVAGYDPAHNGTSTPVVKYAYQQFEINDDDATHPVENAVTTSTLQDDGSYRDSVTIYDGLLRPIQAQAPAVGGGMLVTDTFYNDQGLTYRTNNGYYTDDEPPGVQLFVPKSDYTIPNYTVTAYDGQQRPVTVTTFWNGTEHSHTSTSYTGDSTTVTPPTGGTVTRTWTDARGRTTELDQFTTSSGAAGVFNKTVYQYDGRGLRTEVDDPKGNKWTYAYDARGRVTDATDPDSGSSHYTYDNLDRQLSRTDARGQSIWTNYDDLGRKTSIASGSAVGTTLASWTYDTLPNNGGKLYGQLTASTRYAGTAQYTDQITAVDTDYRPLGRDIIIPDTADTKGLSGTYHYGYTYTPTGKQQTEALPAVGKFSAENLVTRYNADGLPEATTGLNWYTSDTTYSPYGEVLRTVSGEFPNRVWTTNLVDQASRQLTEQVTDREQTTQHRLHDTKYTYDLVGNPLSIDDHTGAGTDDNQCFRYDYLGQLTEAWTSTTTACTTTSGTNKPSTTTLATGTDSYWESYGYDAIGNRTTLVQHQVAGGVDATKDASYSYLYGKTGVTQPHTLTELDATVPGTPTVTSTNTYAYDNSGNTTSRTIGGDSQSLTWNAEGQLDSVTGFSTGSGPVTLLPGGVKKCLDVQSSGTADGTPIQIYSCNGTEAQHWSLTGNTLRSLGKCAQDTGTGVVGDKLQLFNCTGAANQKWTQQADGTFKNPATGLCVDDPSSSTTDGTDLQLNTCNASDSQTWTVDTKTRYLYDADGNRILTVDASQSTLDLGEAEVRANHDGGVTYTTRYYTQAGAPTVIRWGMGSQQLSVQLTDPHGTATTTVRIDSGNTTQDRKFLPYGGFRGQKPTTWPDRTNFVGGTDEATTGLLHMGARDYDPAIGRFISDDPLVDYTNPLQMNGYAYANSNPISNSDSTGKMVRYYADGAGTEQAPVPRPAAPASPGFTKINNPAKYEIPDWITQQQLDAAGDSVYGQALNTIAKYFKANFYTRIQNNILLTQVQVEGPNNLLVPKTVAFLSKNGLKGDEQLVEQLTELGVVIYKAPNDTTNHNDHSEYAAKSLRSDQAAQIEDLGGVIKDVKDAYSTTKICSDDCARNFKEFINDPDVQINPKTTWGIINNKWINDQTMKDFKDMKGIKGDAIDVVAQMYNTWGALDRGDEDDEEDR